MADEKRCTKCGETRPVAEFLKEARRKDGLSCWCRSCRTGKVRKWRADNPEKYAASVETYKRENREELLRKSREYTKRVRASRAEYFKAYAKSKPDLVNERARRWRQKNPDAAKESSRLWKQKNRDRVYAWNAQRRAHKAMAVPSWYGEFDGFVFEEAAALARLRAKVVGGVWHVDHTVPLVSDIVCGLHCAANVAVIPAEENVKKSNRYWPDMPEVSL